jgi:RsiW-degrading membrane proteinase PrsW (M82 family)
MIAELLPRVPVALLPVLAFLAGLILLDSFRLVRPSAVFNAMLVGALVAGASYWANDLALLATKLPLTTYSRAVSPWIEETLKALILVYLVRTRRVGMLVDAAIFGFAIGTGFAVVENLFYLAHRPDAPLALHVVRGFGTAIMHGGATCIFAMVSVALADRRPDGFASVFLPGLAAAVALHAGFNLLLVRPGLATMAVVLSLPPLLYFVFRRSEASLRRWLEADLDSDMALLGLLDSGKLEQSQVGRYLSALRQQYRGEVVADMLCYLRLHCELAMRAKGVLLMRESGLEAEVDEETRAKLVELGYLESSIGRAGQLALRPVLGMTSKDLWQIYLLER